MKKILTILFTTHCLLSFASDTTIFIDRNVDTIIFRNTVTADTSRKLYVVIIAGQSNAEGGDQNGATPVPFANPIPNCLIFYKPTNTSANDGSIQTLDYPLNNNFRDRTKRFGCETAIGYYVTQTGKKIGIIKYAFAGSKLVDTKPTSYGHWQIGATHTPFHSSILTNYFVKPALDSFKAAGYVPYIVAFVWYQGEGDSGDSLAAPQYQAKFTEMISTFKNNIRSRDPVVDSMKIIIARTDSRGAYSSIVRQAQMNVADYWIDTDPYQRIADGVHITRTSQTILGKAIADYIIPLIQ